MTNSLSAEKLRESITRLYPQETEVEIVTVKVEDEIVPIAFKRQGQGMVYFGCPVCIDRKDWKDDGGSLLIGGRKALPLSSIIEDDSYNPVQVAMLLCPLCRLPFVHPALSKKSVAGKVVAGGS